MVLPVIGPGFRGRFWQQTYCERTKTGPRLPGPKAQAIWDKNFGPFVVDEGPKPAPREQAPEAQPGTGSTIEQPEIRCILLRSLLVVGPSFVTPFSRTVLAQQHNPDDKNFRLRNNASGPRTGLVGPVLDRCWPQA